MKTHLVTFLLVFAPFFCYANILNELSDSTMHAKSKRIVLNGNNIEMIQLDSICDNNKKSIKLQMQVDPILPAVITKKNESITKEYYLGQIDSCLNLQVILELEYDLNSNKLLNKRYKVSRQAYQSASSITIEILSDKIDLIPLSDNRIIAIPIIEVKYMLDNGSYRKYCYSKNSLLAL